MAESKLSRRTVSAALLCDSVSVAAGRIRHRARIGRIVSLDGRAPVPVRGRNETRRRPYFNWWAEGRSPWLPLRRLAICASLAGARFSLG